MRTSSGLLHRLLAAVAITLVALGVLPGAVPSASAAEIQVEGCELDGEPTEATVETDDLGPYEGGWYALVDMTGTPIDHSSPLGGLSTTPVCVLPVADGTLDSSQATWAFCTQPEAPAPGHSPCVEDAMLPGTSPFTEEQNTLAAYIIAEQVASPFTTTEDLEETQDIVQCITAGVEPEILGLESCEEVIDLLTIAVIPNLVQDDSTLEVTASSTPNRFSVTSSLPNLVLRTNNGSDIALCPGQTGPEIVEFPPELEIEFAYLTAEPGTVVEVCTSGGDGGPTALGSSSMMPRLEIGSFIGAEGPSAAAEPCAIFLTDTTIGDYLVAAATSTVAPTTTTTTTAPTSPTTTTTTPSRQRVAPKPLAFAG